jgi:hypothetical protein
MKSGRAADLLGMEITLAQWLVRLVVLVVPNGFLAATGWS